MFGVSGCTDRPIALALGLLAALQAAFGQAVIVVAAVRGRPAFPRTGACQPAR